MCALTYPRMPRRSIALRSIAYGNNTTMRKNGRIALLGLLFGRIALLGRLSKSSTRKMKRLAIGERRINHENRGIYLKPNLLC